MTSFAPLLETFFTKRLHKQRQVSPNTVIAYRDTFRLLLRFVQQRLGKPPSDLLLTDLNASVIGAFLDYLETVRNNSPRTRNARLAAIRSFFRYIATEEPAHVGLIQRVLAIPQKRFDRPVVDYLSRHEVEALLEATNRTTWIGRRDHTLLSVAIQTGLRVSELINLRGEQLMLGPGSHIRCRGKGRKERITPLTRQTSAILRVWLRELNPNPTDPTFPSQRGGVFSHDAVEKLVAKYSALAEQACPSMKGKRVTPHVLRHTAAVQLLQAGVDCSVIALWLGHESVETTQIYLHADLTIKEKAIARTDPLPTRPGRYRPDDQLLTFLRNL